MSRKLDVWIAENVMGWIRSNTQLYQSGGKDKYGLYTHTIVGTFSSITDGKSTFVLDAPIDIDPNQQRLPTYSTSIGSAWEVVEKLPLFGIYKRDGKWAVSVDIDPIIMVDDSASMAICLAAYKLKTGKDWDEQSN